MSAVRPGKRVAKGFTILVIVGPNLTSRKRIGVHKTVCYGFAWVANYVRKIFRNDCCWLEIEIKTRTYRNNKHSSSLPRLYSYCDPNILAAVNKAAHQCDALHTKSMRARDGEMAMDEWGVGGRGKGTGEAGARKTRGRGWLGAKD